MSTPVQYAVLDDRSTNFQYQSGLWGNQDNVSDAYDNTLSFTTAVANATISFTGSQAFVYGVLGQSSVFGIPTAKFYLDGNLDAWGTAPSVASDIYNKLYYDTGALSSGDHQIIVENTVNGTTLFLDYLYFVPSSTTSSSLTVVTVTDTPPQLATGSPGSSSKSVPVGAVVGGIIGGIALLGVIAIATFFLIRRRRGSTPYYYKSVSPADLLESELPELKHPTSAASFVSSFPPEGLRAGPSSDYDTLSPLAFQQRQSTSDVGYVYPPNPSATTSGVVSSTLDRSESGHSGSPNRPLILSKKAAMAASGAQRMPVRQETDSGVRFGEAGPSHLPQVEDVPPEYSER